MPRRQRVLLMPLLVTLLASMLPALHCVGHPVSGAGKTVDQASVPHTTSASPPAPTPADLTPLHTRTADPQDNYFPNIILHTQDNQPRRFYTDLLRGKVVLINFMYVTCGDICPLATTNLVRVQNALGERLGREVFIYSITMDPQTDTPAVLKQYAAGYRTKPGWYFLTGQDEEIQSLRRKLGIYDRDPVIDADKTQHSGLIVYGNEATGKWAVIPAMLNPARIVQAVLRAMGSGPGGAAPSRP